MSKYLMIVHDESASDTITSWLDHHGSDATERWSTRLSGGRTLLILSADAARNIRGRTFFTGFAVSQEAATVAFGIDGWKRGGRELDDPITGGSFVAIEWSRSEVRIRHDFFGTVPVLQAHGPGFIAVSDSLAVLADLRSRFGLANTPHQEVLLARSGLTPRHTQGSSPDTPVREITALPVGRSAVIKVNHPMVLDIVGDDFATVLASAAVDERTAYRDAAAFTAGLVRSLADSAPGLRLRSSAGVDSVALLAAASAAGVLDRVPVETDASSDEAEAVQALATELGARVVLETREEEPSVVARWGASGLGVYDQVTPLGLPADAAARVQVDGIGGKLLRVVWGGTDAAGLVAAGQLQGAARDAYAAQVAKGFHSLGLEPDRPNSSELFYAAYRHGLHSASVPATGVPVRPLQQLPLLASLHSAAEDPSSPSHEREPIDVLTALLDARVLRSRASTASESVRALTESAVFGGSLTAADIATVSVYGSPTDATSHPTALGASVAEGLGLRVDRNDEILARAEAALEAIDDTETVDALRPLLGNARWHLIDRERPPAESGPSLGKLLGLAVFVS